MTDQTGEVEPPWADVLDAIRRAISESSLRKVARDLDMNPGGLTKVLNGSVTRPSTRRKLLDWYVRYLPTARTPTAAWLETVLRQLVVGLPFARRADAKDRIRSELARLHREAGAAIPRWLVQ